MGLTREQIHFWEHAALLYRGYEWQASVDAFLSLSKKLKRDTSSQVRCLLNAGMIQARLGDYNEAAQTLELAASVDSTYTFTPFLLGVVEWERGNAIKSEASFRVCLRHTNRRDIDYLIQGLDYVLETDIVLYNIKSTQYKYVKRRATLLAVPAECIFEAPERTSSTWSNPVSIMDRKRFEPIDDTTIHERHSDSSSQSSSRYSLGTITPEPHVNSSLQVPILRPEIEPVSPPKPVSIARIAHKYRDMLPQSSNQSSNQINPHNAWCRRPRTPFIARDARGEHESTAALSNFLRKHTHTDEPLVPKDAKGEWDTKSTMRGMQTFVRYAGKGIADRRSVGLYGERTQGFDNQMPMHQDAVNRDRSASVNDVDTSVTPDFRNRAVPPSPSTATTHKETDDESDKGSSSTITSATSSTFKSPSHVEYTTQSRENQLFQNRDETALDFVLSPTVYKPAKNITKNSDKNPSPAMDLIVTPPPVVENPQPWDCYRHLHTAGSETSSLFAASINTTERRRRATDAAMRMLEGRPRSRLPRISRTKTARDSSPLSTTSKMNGKNVVGKTILASALKRKMVGSKRSHEEDVEHEHRLGPHTGASEGLTDVEEVVEDINEDWPRSTVSSSSFFRYVASGN